MITTKHFMEPIESGKGPRVWIEPVLINHNIRICCKIDEVIPALGPPRHIWDWFTTHPVGYQDFVLRYHTWLSKSQLQPMLQQLAYGALLGNFTLLHSGIDATRNCATALKDYITALETLLPSDRLPHQQRHEGPLYPTSNFKQPLSLESNRARRFS